MGANPHGVASEADKQTKDVHERSSLSVDEPTTSKVCEHSASHACCESTEAKPMEVVRDELSIPYVYRQDVVRNNGNDMIGIVTEVAGDSDSDGSLTDDDEDDEDDDDSDNDDEDDNDNGDDNDNEDADKEALENGENDEVGNGNPSGSVKRSKDDSANKSKSLPADQIRVLWIDNTETIQKLSDVKVVDRGFLHGDYVAAASDPTGQVGVVVDVNIYVDLEASDGSIIEGVSSRELKRVSEFTVGDFVVLGPWLGRVDDVMVNVTVMFDDGHPCKVMKADPLSLRPVGKNVLDDGHFAYYPGQRVKATTSSVFKNANWLSGSWSKKRVEGTIIKVAVGSVFIYWIASAGYGPDSSTAPAEEQSPKNLKLLSCFSHANWQLGDWCLLPSLSSSIPLDKDCSKLKLRDSANDNTDEPAEHGEFVNLDGNDSSSNSPSAEASSKLPTSKGSVHEARPLYRKKICKVRVKRDKKARKKEEKFERALLISNTKTKVGVAWQDGTVEHGLDALNLIPVDSPGDHEFVPEQYVVEKMSDDNDDVCAVRRVGVVKSVNAKERTACVRWLKTVTRAEDPREFDKEDVVSVYELEEHADYDYCHGDVVVRLSPVSVSTPTDCPENFAEGSKQMTDNGVNQDLENPVESIRGCASKSGVKSCMEFSDLSWVGNITGLKNGDIEVTWADGMVSVVGPQAVYVVGRDDDESIGAGSEIGDDAASWETVNDDEVDALEKTEEEPGLNMASDVISDKEQSTEVGENISGKNGPLSLSLAALGFVTKLATGIFSRGRKHIDPVPVEFGSSSKIHSQDVTMNTGSKASIEESGLKNPNCNGTCSSQVNGNIEGRGHVAEAAKLDVTEDLCNLRTDYSVTSFRRFDTSKDPLDHYFLGASGQNSNGRKWLKKVQQDWSILQNNLPDGIYVRVYEDRMDLLRAVIVGAYGTPYQDGLFFFDFYLPPDYPSIPPSAYYHSGGWRINPNLYEEGKVCLSLLNTWTGKGNEVWDPMSSSILQVLVSLQGLVLNSKPYYNEAGYDKQIGTAEGEKNSLSYNENTFLLNCKTMMFLMRKPPKDFEDLIKEHFKRRGYFILKACDAYMKGSLIGSLKSDASTSDISDTNATSVGFKLMLAKLAPRLCSALNEHGVDCQDFEHLL